MDVYSLAIVLLSSIGMAALGARLVFDRRHEDNLSAFQAQIRDLKEQTKSTQNRIDDTNKHLLTVTERLESSLHQLTERVTAFEADLVATTGLNGKLEITYFRKELQRLSRANAGIHDELSTILKHIDARQRSADGLALAVQQTTEPQG